jgi:chemotaxis protein methyltransferase CheR
MITAPAPADHVARFGAAVARVLGLQFDETRRGVLVDALERRVEATSVGVDQYLDELERASLSRDEIRALARELTVGETYFFRNMAQFNALAEAVLPERLGVRSSVRRLRILSAGCASGEEAYSIAMTARDRITESGWDVSITGVDVNSSSLEKAKLGLYSKWSLRETPPELQRRWFRASAREHALDPSILRSVRFEERNLADPAPGFWMPDSYDVIFCRNVLMYFTPEIARAVVDRATRALMPRGYLFLGHAETLRGLSHDYHLCHTHDTFYYQRKEVLSDGIDVAQGGHPASVPDGILSVEVTWASTWVETIRRSADEIETISNQRGASFDPAPALPRPRVRRPDIGRAMQLLERERFADALALLGELPPDAMSDPDVLLLRAVLLTHSGQLEAAESACFELRGVDELSAGAHYLLALCREGVGDRSGAAEHNRVAAYLDPGFAMPHLHLGLLARRAGDLTAAQRELKEALVLLAREDASRVLLFGGGFTREALTNLCRAELRAVGGDR